MSDNNPCRRGHIGGRYSDGHCKECNALRSAEVRKKPETLQYMREWRKNNSDKRRDYERKWRAVNPEANRVRILKRRAFEFAAEGSHTAEELADLFATQFDCQGCHCEFDESNTPTVDHIVALKLGGTNWISNLQLLCRSCNSAKGAKTKEEWEVICDRSKESSASPG